jgi:hypothetical protein
VQDLENEVTIVGKVVTGLIAFSLAIFSGCNRCSMCDRTDASSVRVNDAEGVERVVSSIRCPTIHVDGDRRDITGRLNCNLIATPMTNIHFSLVLHSRKPFAWLSAIIHRMSALYPLPNDGCYIGKEYAQAISLWSTRLQSQDMQAK